ncbi:hypothetical protein V6N13_020927 [Hibiscus sabdariffa]|uniref:non-specific serine/threonine protein kinase n=1 Tax=Hibiscus sabdariffa TaxID=183260 RepID=A0ABR2EX23_9ROSI
MNVMRRLKIISSGRPSISTNPGGNASTKKAKVDQQSECKVNEESNLVERSTADTGHHMASSSRKIVTSSSYVTSDDRIEKPGVDQLPNEMQEMTIRDEKTADQDEDMEATVINGNGEAAGQIISDTNGDQNGQPKQDMEASVINGNGTESGQIIPDTVGGQNGQPKQDMEAAVINGNGTEASQIISATIGCQNGQPKQDMEATVIDGNGTEAGQIIPATSGGQNGQPKQYMEGTVIDGNRTEAGQIIPAIVGGQNGQPKQYMEGTVIDGNRTEAGQIIPAIVGGQNGQPKQYMEATVIDGNRTEAGQIIPAIVGGQNGQPKQDMEATVINGSGTEAGQIILATIGGENGQPKQTISYKVEYAIGTGSFGVVFQAKCLESGESVAIKKVLQDKRYKNRELQIMRMLDHPNVVQLKRCFFSSTEKDELYLNLVLEYVPETVYQVSKHYSKMNQHMPIVHVQLYVYQICRGLNYLHRVVCVCHRDIKPQNLLVNPHNHQVKICDFGSAKMLVPGEPNISYICSRYYRAPELIFGATVYTTAIDMWSVGCVMAELLLGQTLFPGESGVDQLVEIIKILGTPTREEIKCMNPDYNEFKFPQIKAHPWHKIFQKQLPPEAVDLVSRLLQYSPNLRCTALEACAHPFFDDLRQPNACLPNGQALPPLFNFTDKELVGASPELRQRLIPEHART